MKTYALLVGLEKYQNRIKPLTGCINDVTLFGNYLKNKLNVPENHVKTLKNNEATKVNIVTTFQNHFAQATKDDVVIFYFAGHGVTQAANPVFLKTAVNGVLECITCSDSTLDGHNMIADKELRWLINGLSERTGCHILVINDCCHSGDSTRSIEDDNEQVRMMTDEQGTPIDVPMRPWKEFIFSSEITERAVERNDLNAILPQGKHIQLAACSSEELAQEDLIVRRGRFSMYLLDLLENSGGKLTYYDLRSLIFRRMSTLKKRQTPQFYAHNDTLFQPFLGGAAQTEVQANVNFNNEKNEWQMDMGSVYGIPQGAAVFVNLPNKKPRFGLRDCAGL